MASFKQQHPVVEAPPGASGRPQAPPPPQPATTVHPYVSPWRKWAIAAFVLLSLFSIVFCVLSGFSYQALRNLTDDLNALPTTPLGYTIDALTALFRGAAASAAFAFLLTILAIALSSFLLLCNRRSVAHPNRTVTRKFLIAAMWYTGLHILNIAIIFHSALPLMRTVRGNFGVSLNIPLLTAAVAFGYMSAAMYFLFGLLLAFWHERPDLFQVDSAPAGTV